MGWLPERAGGLNRVYYELERHLPGAGVGFTGLVTGSSMVYASSGGRVKSVCPTDAPLAVRCWHWRAHVRRALAADKELLPAAHFALYAFAALGALRGRPLAIHFHGPWARESREEGCGRLSTWSREGVERAVYRQGSVFIVLSNAFGQILQRTYRVEPERIRVVPGGVDAGRFAVSLSRTAARETLGWTRNRPILLSVRRLVRRMGLEDLIMAAGLVRRRVPEVLFLVAGTGPLAGELAARIRENDLQDNVHLLGYVPEDRLPLAYRAANATVVPTVALEGFGLTVPESLAAGTPVLVTPVGGLPETVAGLSPHLVLPDPGPQPLADTILRFLEGTLIVPSAEQCQAYARARYDWPIIAAQVADAYELALG